MYNKIDGGNKANVNGVAIDDAIPEEEVIQARLEEKEMLLAMFGFIDEDDEAAAKFSNMEDETIFDVSLPITNGYEPPARYESPPQLMMEVYVDNNIAPLYPNEPPVIALVGGGLSEAQLKELTSKVHAEAQERAMEEPGVPQIFNLITFVGEAADSIVQGETLELEEEERKKKVLEAEARREAQLKAGGGALGSNSAGGGAGAFTSEAERRAYAMEIAARAGDFNTKAGTGNEDISGGKTTKGAAAKPKFNAKTGVSDRSLIDDLFS